MKPEHPFPNRQGLHYNVNSRIEAAHTLPGSFYQDPRAWESLMEGAMARSWQFLLHEADLGSFDWYPVTLLPDTLNEPLLLCRSAADWRCFSNVCTHRGHLLAEQPGCGLRLRCRYHGRCFDREGQMQSAPGFEGAEAFPAQEDHLPELPLRRLGGLLFTFLQPEKDSAKQWETMAREVENRLPPGYLDRLQPRPDLDVDYPVEAHWALYCENYLEGFHIPYVHPGLNKILDYGAYQTEYLDGGSSLQLGVARQGEMAFPIRDQGPDAGQAIAAYYYFLFPNLMLNFYPWGLSLNLVQPLSPERCLVRFRTFVAHEELLGQAYDIDGVQREDEDVVHSVQRGVRARLYHRGRFSPQHEKGVYHFQCELASRVAAHSSSPSHTR
jgi:choline monooxygenase